MGQQVQRSNSWLAYAAGLGLVGGAMLGILVAVLVSSVEVALAVPFGAGIGLVAGAVIGLLWNARRR